MSDESNSGLASPSPLEQVEGYGWFKLDTAVEDQVGRISSEFRRQIADAPTERRQEILSEAVHRFSSEIGEIAKEQIPLLANAYAGAGASNPAKDASGFVWRAILEVLRIEEKFSDAGLAAEVKQGGRGRSLLIDLLAKCCGSYSVPEHWEEDRWIGPEWISQDFLSLAAEQIRDEFLVARVGGFAGANLHLLAARNSGSGTNGQPASAVAPVSTPKRAESDQARFDQFAGPLWLSAQKERKSAGNEQSVVRLVRIGVDLDGSEFTPPLPYLSREWADKLRIYNQKNAKKAIKSWEKLAGSPSLRRGMTVRLSRAGCNFRRKSVHKVH